MGQGILMSDTLGSILFYLFILAIALLLGLIIPVLDIKLVIVLFSALVGSVLIFFPKQLLWLTLLMSLLFAGLIKYFMPGMEKIWWISYGLAFLLMVSMLPKIIQYVATFKVSKSNIVLFMFFQSVLIALIYNANTISTLQLLTSFKNIIMFTGVWLVLKFYPFTRKEIRHFFYAFLTIGCFQILPVLYQYVFVRDIRLRFSVGDTVEASDSVVGTFGGSMTGGGLTAVLAIFLIMGIVFLVAYKRKQLIATPLYIFSLFLLSIPLLLIEVKAIFIYLPVVIVLLYRDKIFQNPGYALLSLLMLSGLLLILLVAYQNFHWSGKSADLDKNTGTLFSYSFKSRLSDNPSSIAFMGGKQVLSRKETVDLWLSQQNKVDLVNTLFGYGPGASKSGAISRGYIANKFYPLNIDRTGIALLLWDYGVIGTVLILFFIYSYYQKSVFIYKQTQDNEYAAIALALSAIFPLFILSILYRNDIPFAAPMMFLLMFALGLTDWLKQQVLKEEPEGV